MRGGPPCEPRSPSRAPRRRRASGTKPSWRAAAASRQAAMSTAPRCRSAAGSRPSPRRAAADGSRGRHGRRRAPAGRRAQPARRRRAPPDRARPASPRRTRGTAAASGARSGGGSGGRGSPCRPRRPGGSSRQSRSARPSPRIGGEQRVRPLARQVRRQSRDPEADRVERPVEAGRAELDRAQQRLGVRDRRRAGVSGRRGRELERERADQPHPRGAAAGRRLNSGRAASRTIRSSDAGS